MPFTLPDPQLPPDPGDALQSIQRNFEALALAQGGPSYQTTLPATPFEGQEIYYAADAADSIIWHLRYRGAARSGDGAWEFVGGSPLYDEVDAFQSTSTVAPLNHNTLQDLATVGPSITVPLKGFYTFDVYAHTKSPGSGNAAYVHLVIGGSDKGEFVSTGDPDGFSSLAGVTQETISSTSTIAKLQYRSFNDTQSSYERRRLLVTPIFVYS